MPHYLDFSQKEIPNIQQCEQTHLPCDIYCGQTHLPCDIYCEQTHLLCDIYCNIARFAVDDPSWKTLQQNILHFLNENIKKIELTCSSGIIGI